MTLKCGEEISQPIDIGRTIGRLAIVGSTCRIKDKVDGSGQDAETGHIAQVCSNRLYARG